GSNYVSHGRPKDDRRVGSCVKENTRRNNEADWVNQSNRDCNCKNEQFIAECVCDDALNSSSLNRILGTTKPRKYAASHNREDEHGEAKAQETFHRQGDLR